MTKREEQEFNQRLKTEIQEKKKLLFDLRLGNMLTSMDILDMNQL